MKKDTSTYLLIAGGVVLLVLIMRSTPAKAATPSLGGFVGSLNNIVTGLGNLFRGAGGGPASSNRGTFAVSNGVTTVPADQTRTGSDFTFDDGSTLDGPAPGFSGTGNDLLAPDF